jgi:hypothetical protein
MGVPPTGQVAIAVAQRGVLQNPGGATGNLGGAAAGIATRSFGRSGFRKEVARQVKGAQGQAGQAQAGQTQVGQAQVGQAQVGQAQVGQAQAGQAQTGQTQAGQAQAGQQQTGQQQAGQQQAGQQQTGQQQTGQQQAGQQQAGQQQAGTPTNNNPVAQKLLLAPTFTPIAANAVLDQTNMRIAIPVRQVDGEYILTMQKMGAVQQIQPAAGATPAEGQTATPSAAPKAETSAAAAEPGKASNGTESAAPKPESAKKPEGEKKPERRQESGKDKYGNDKPPQGAIIMTMKMIDDMVDSYNWAGQAAITKMMSEYVKAQTGKDIQPVNGTEAATGTAKITV